MAPDAWQQTHVAPALIVCAGLHIERYQRLAAASSIWFWFEQASLNQQLAGAQGGTAER
jgi:hypothetical protein